MLPVATAKQVQLQWCSHLDPARWLLFPLGYVAIKAARHVLSVPRAVIVPMILVCCFIGSFAVNNTLFGVWTMLVAGRAQA